MNITRLLLLSLLIQMFASSAANAQASAAHSPDPVLVASAEKEGSLLLYSVTSAENWKSVIQAFNARYPRIAVATLDLPSAPECFERFSAESATNSRTADLIVAQGRENWLDFYKRGELLPYESPEAPNWPAWSKPVPGLYSPWTLAVVLVWNNILVPPAQRPRTMAEFVRTATANGASWRSRIGSYSATVFGASINYAFVQRHGEQGWVWLQSLAKLQPRLERSAGPMVEKLASGEYAAAWFVSSNVLWSRMNDPARAKLLGWSFIGDGQPIVPTGAGIPKRARNVNAAKLFLDFMLSAEGQRAIGRGGQTPARPDVKPDRDIAYTYSSIAEKVGGDGNVILVDWAPSEKRDMDGFIARWRTTFGVR